MGEKFKLEKTKEGYSRDPDRLHHLEISNVEDRALNRSLH
jgi:hypothetical protein